MKTRPKPQFGPRETRGTSKFVVTGGPRWETCRPSVVSGGKPQAVVEIIPVEMAILELAEILTSHDSSNVGRGGGVSRNPMARPRAALRSQSAECNAATSISGFLPILHTVS